LALGGKTFLPRLEEEFERLGIWDYFMTVLQPAVTREKALMPRDGSSGNYATHNVRDRLMDETGAARPRGEDGKISRVNAMKQLDIYNGWMMTYWIHRKEFSAYLFLGGVRNGMLC
jgi:hypothetical protein